MWQLPLPGSQPVPGAGGRPGALCQLRPQAPGARGCPERAAWSVSVSTVLLWVMETPGTSDTISYDWGDGTGSRSWGFNSVVLRPAPPLGVTSRCNARCKIPQKRAESCRSG